MQYDRLPACGCFKGRLIPCSCCGEVALNEVVPVRVAGRVVDATSLTNRWDSGAVPAPRQVQRAERFCVVTSVQHSYVSTGAPTGASTPTQPARSRGSESGCAKT